MNLDDQPIGSHGDRTTTEHLDQASDTAPLAWVDDHWKVRLHFGHSHRGKVERIAGERFKRSDAAFAEHHVGIPIGEEVLGGEKPLFNLLAQSALEKDRFAG